MNTLAKSATIAARSARPVSQNGQKRSIVDWMTKFPDKVMETKRIQMKGGTCQAEANPTWLKQPGDQMPLIVGGTLIAFGIVNSVIGHYRLATGKGKLE